MPQSYLGIDIGTNRIKFAVLNPKRGIKKLTSVTIPEGLVSTDGVNIKDNISKIIYSTAKKYRLLLYPVGITLPASSVFLCHGRIHDSDNLTQRLSGLFRSRIKSFSDYNYDYLTIDQNNSDNSNSADSSESFGSSDSSNQPDILAAAVPKKLINSLSRIITSSGLSLTTAVPAQIAYMNILRSYVQHGLSGQNDDNCILDIGHTSVDIHFFSGYRYLESTQLLLGVRMLDDVISGTENVDILTAQRYKESGHKVLSGKDCTEIFNILADEIYCRILTVVPSIPSHIYCCGGGSMLPQLISAIQMQLQSQVAVRHIYPLFSAANQDNLHIYTAAVGGVCQF